VRIENPVVVPESAVPPLDAAPPRARSWLTRWRWLFIALALLAVGVFVGLWWAEEPSRQRFVFFEAPLRLETGQRVTGAFVPERGGPLDVEIRVPRDRDYEDLRRRTSRDVPGYHEPPGLVATCIVRDQERVVLHSAGDPTFVGWGGGPGYAYVLLAQIRDSRPVAHTIDVEIVRAVPGLASYDARMAVTVSSDRRIDAFKATLGRQIIVVVGAVFTLLAIIFTAAMSARRRAIANHRRALDGPPL
jgi:hypothetical protein